MEPHRTDSAGDPWETPPRVNAAKGWGVVSFVILAAGLLPLLIMIVLATVVDPLYGWYMIVIVPLLLLACAISAVLGIIGVVIAARQQNGYRWPLLGLVPSAVIMIVILTVFLGQ
ncbi:hypothetical protein ACI3KS_16935 [Microbacterium sp. ZW T5_45]|uniref:hypothetical protein n=1 Tax=Microbacterium sp. ZW T5_45 TaxID=3378080 RepID=UPI003852E245